MAFDAHVLTLFPEMFPGILGCSVVGNALLSGLWRLNVTNIRQFGITKHNTVDDSPFGGGAGMVMRPDVLGDAIDSVVNSSNIECIYYASPRGKRFTQRHAEIIASQSSVLFLAGRFEGVDQRVIDEYNVQEVSLGDFVLSGGEIAVMAMIDAVVRLIPGVVSNHETLLEESFSLYDNGRVLLEYPLYTRPAEWRGHVVPEVLRSGDHAKIAKWRLEQSKELTIQRRPDLWYDFNANKDA